MEIGNFLEKIKGKEKDESKKFLALILTDEVVQAAVWHVMGENAEIVTVGTPVEWDGDTGTTNELVTAVDATISSATEGFEEEPSSVILGIPYSWTDKNGVLGVKREFISKIRKELDLEAIGYVIITDSILSYLKLQEGTPATSILIQVSRDELTLVLVRLGRIESIELIGRSDDVVEDVTEGIARFKSADNLPSRIILFNSMHNLDDLIQNLLSANWPSQFNFLHLPKIEALAKDISIRALVLAGGSEVAKSLGFTVSTVVPDMEVKEPVQATDTPTLDLLSAQEIGFSEPSTKQAKIDPIDPDNVSVEAIEADPHPSKRPKLSFTLPKPQLPKFHLPKFSLNFSSTKPHVWYLSGLLLVMGILTAWFIWILPKALVTIEVTPKELSENVKLTLSTTSNAINFAERVVPASIESVTETGEKVIETTGKKIIGDPSVGEVTIYNRTPATKAFAKGTTLSFGSLKFTLDQDILVASKSAGSDYVDLPGKATVKVTAKNIGEDSNLGAGTEFTVLSFGKDSYVGKNESAFSGGTSQEVRVVGKDDQKTLTQELTEELLLSLTTKSSKSLTPGTGIYLIPSSAKVDTVTYSAKIGETAKTLTANLTLKVSLLKYRTEDVTTLVNSSIDQAVPKGYVRANLPSTVDLSASSVDEKNENVKGSAKVKVALLPVIDKSTLTNLIKGKSGKSLESILSSFVVGYHGAELRILPTWIPSRLKSIPLNPSHITIQIKPAL